MGYLVSIFFLHIVIKTLIIFFFQCLELKNFLHPAERSLLQKILVIAENYRFIKDFIDANHAAIFGVCENSKCISTERLVALSRLFIIHVFRTSSCSRTIYSSLLWRPRRCPETISTRNHKIGREYFNWSWSDVNLHFFSSWSILIVIYSFDVLIERSM